MRCTTQSRGCLKASLATSLPGLRETNRLPRPSGTNSGPCAGRGAGQDCLGRYGEEKRNNRLVDYPDMLAGSFDILSKRRDVLELFRDRIDCLVIDEFQDTNPPQFALLWKIFEAGVPGMIVGDVKQSIMGFQNPDPRLVGVLRKGHP